MDIIQKQYFSEKNTLYIQTLLSKSHQINMLINDIYSLQYIIYNEYSHDQYLDMSKLEEYLITLNKYTLKYIINKYARYNEIQPSKTSESLQDDPWLNIGNNDIKKNNNQTEIEIKLTNETIEPKTLSSNETKLINQDLKIQYLGEQINILQNTINEINIEKNNTKLKCKIVAWQGMLDKKEFNIESVTFKNNFYNVNNLKIIINNKVTLIPNGNYNLNELLNVLQELTKIEFKYIKYKNRININDKNTFSLKFVDNLKCILGFSKNEYINNNNYTSENDNNIESLSIIKFVINDKEYIQNRYIDLINTFTKYTNVIINQYIELNEIVNNFKFYINDIEIIDFYIELNYFQESI